MNNWEKIVDVVYNAYETSDLAKNIDAEEYDKSFKEFMALLNDEQKKAFHAFDISNFYMQEKHEKTAIRYVLELICPEIVNMYC